MRCEMSLDDGKIAALGLGFRGASAANGEEILKQGDGFFGTHAGSDFDAVVGAVVA